MQLETPLGTVNAGLTNATHAYLRGEVTVFSVTYNFTLHLFRQPDGSWSKEDKPHHNCFHNLYMSRADRSMKEPTHPARKKVEKVMAEAWTAAVTNEMRIEAEKAHLQEEIERAEEKAKELREQLEEAENQARLAFVEKQLLDSDSMGGMEARRKVLNLTYTPRE